MLCKVKLCGKHAQMPFLTVSLSACEKSVGNYGHLQATDRFLLRIACSTHHRWAAHAVRTSRLLRLGDSEGDVFFGYAVSILK
jgi:hypothetical protein